MSKPSRIAFRAIVALVLLGFLGMCSQTTVSYTAICARCVQNLHGVESSVFGIEYSHKERFTQNSGGLMSPAIFGSPIPQIDPHTYDKIFDHPCEHKFIRGGFCRYSWNMVGCGASGRARDYEFRNALIENLYRAYLRTKDKNSTRDAYKLIDELFPIGKQSSRSELSDPRMAEWMPNEPASVLLRGLALVKTSDELRQILSAARGGDGTVALLGSRDLLVTRMHDPDPTVQRQAIDQLAKLKDPLAWEAIATMLNDPIAAGHAVERIVGAPYLPLFDRALEADERMRPRNVIVDPLAPFGVSPSLKDAEIRQLFEQGKPRVDLLCLAVIRRGNRFSFLDDVLALLNKRPSPAAVATINSLIAGPIRKDPLQMLKANRKMITDEANGTGSSESTRRMWQMELQVISLASNPIPASWDKFRELHGRWRSEGGNDDVAAAIAEAMYDCDGERTLEFLRSELDIHDPKLTRTATAIMTLGAIADPRGLTALEEFSELSKSDKNPNNRYYDKYLVYALHRCRGIHKWQLVKNPDSTYSISRSK